MRNFFPIAWRLFSKISFVRFSCYLRNDSSSRELGLFFLFFLFFVFPVGGDGFASTNGDFSSGFDDFSGGFNSGRTDAINGAGCVEHAC